MNRRQAVTLGIVLAVVIATGAYVYLMFFGGGKPPEATPVAETRPPVVRIGSFSTAIDYAPLQVAKAQGRFQRTLGQAATVDFKVFETLPTINESLAANRLDIIFEAEPPAIVGTAAGIELTIAAVSASLRQEIVVPDASPIRTIGDLRGKKIAVLAGTSSHYGLLKVAEEGGVPKSALQVIDMAPPDAKAAFADGLVDAWAVWPPWVEQELVAGKGRVLEGGEEKIHSVMVMRRAFATDSPALARQCKEVIEQTKAWILANPEEAQRLVARELNLPIEVVALAWPKHDWGAQLDPAIIADIQAKADFLLNERLIRRRVDVGRELVAVTP